VLPVRRGHDGGRRRSRLEPAAGRTSTRARLQARARATALLAGTVAAALGLGACSGHHDGSAPPPPAATSTASARPGLPAAVAHAYATTVGRAGATYTFTYSYRFHSTGPTAQLATTGSGSVNFAAHASQSTHSAAGLTGQSRLIGFDVYDQVSPLPGSTAGPGRWTHVDTRTASTTNGATDLGADDFALRVGYLDVALPPAAQVGTETVAGVATTRYRLKVDIRPTSAGGTLSPMAAAFHHTIAGADSEPLDVWIDQAGVVRRLRTDVTSDVPGGGQREVILDVTYTAFGPPPTITPPPAAQISPG
jgi:hypothetical protein